LGGQEAARRRSSLGLHRLRDGPQRLSLSPQSNHLADGRLLGLVRRHDALQVVDDLRKRGVGLHLLDLGGDISGNGLSKLFLTIAAAFAEAERDRIRERIGQVKANQKARGRFGVSTARSTLPLR
jgi:DNA invertase Pin-like site-specific DNA recombinase